MTLVTDVHVEPLSVETQSVPRTRATAPGAGALIHASRGGDAPLLQACLEASEQEHRLDGFLRKLMTMIVTDLSATSAALYLLEGEEAGLAIASEPMADLDSPDSRRDRAMRLAGIGRGSLAIDSGALLITPRNAGLRRADVAAPVQAVLLAPLHVAGRLRGGVAVAFDRPLEPAGISSDRLQAFCEQALLTLELARLADAEREAAVARAHAEAARERTEVFTRFNRAGRATLQSLTEGPDLHSFLAGIAQVATQQFQAEGASVWTYDADAGEVEFLVVYQDGVASPPPPGGAGPRWKIEMGELFRGQVLEHRAPDFAGVIPEFVPLMLARGIQSGLCMPLFLGEACHGLLTVTFLEDRYWTEEEVEFAGALANQAVLAIELTRLSEAAKEAALTSERNRMAAEIHDTLAQSFAAILMQLQALDQSPARAIDERRLATAIKQARQGLLDARRSLDTLRPQSTQAEDVDLRAELERIALEFASRSRAKIVCEGAARLALPSMIGREVVRIAQEATSNAVRHAHARQVTLRLDERPDGATLSVKDDGAGFSADAVRGGHGMAIMEERAARVDAALTFVSAPGEGAEVLLSWSLGDRPPQLAAAGTLRPVAP